MKKILSCVALATSGLLALPVLAQDAATPTTDTPSATTTPAANGNYQPNQAVGSGNWFIDGNIGQGHLAKGPYNDHPTTYAINGGYRWKVGPDLGLGVDVGYNDLGNVKLKNVFNSQDVYQKAQQNALRGWTAGVNGRINVWQGLYVSGRAGVYGWRGHGYDNQSLNRHKLNQTSYYAGAGVGYDINDHIGLGVSYDYYNASKSHIKLSSDTASLTAEYRF